MNNDNAQEVMMKRFRAPVTILLLAAASALLLMSGCKPSQPRLTVAAAASLKDAMTEIQALYCEANPDLALSVTYGGSGALQQQIEQGAAVDVFIAANQASIQALADKELVDPATVQTLLGNRLVLIAPSGATPPVTGFADAAADSVKRLAVGEPRSVPAGQYAEQVFAHLGVWDAVRTKIAYGKDVREVLTWVESGNADLGVVYATDARRSDRVRVLATAPEESHSPIRYPAAVIRASRDPDAADSFLSFLKSDPARAVFLKYGFSVYDSEGVSL